MERVLHSFYDTCPGVTIGFRLWYPLLFCAGQVGSDPRVGGSAQVGSDPGEAEAGRVGSLTHKAIFVAVAVNFLLPAVPRRLNRKLDLLHHPCDELLLHAVRKRVP